MADNIVNIDFILIAYSGPVDLFLFFQFSTMCLYVCILFGDSLNLRKKKKKKAASKITVREVDFRFLEKIFYVSGTSRLLGGRRSGPEKSPI